jgi:hypothetical protein
MASNKLVKYDYDGTYVDSIDISSQTDKIYLTTDGIGVSYTDGYYKKLTTYNFSLLEIRECFAYIRVNVSAILSYSGDILLLSARTRTNTGYSNNTSAFSNSQSGDLDNAIITNRWIDFSSSDFLKSSNNIYYSATNEKLRKVDITTGPPATITTYASRQFYYADYFNGEIYCIKSTSNEVNNTVFVIDVTDGSITREWEY